MKNNEKYYEKYKTIYTVTYATPKADKIHEEYHC